MSKEETARLIDEQFKEELLSKLNQLRKEGILCDVTLRIEGQDFPAHRCVLSAASPYFRALFTSELAVENNSIELKEIKSPAATEALRFIYTGEARVHYTNAQDLLRTADYLIIEGLKAKVATFLKGTIDATNCLLLEALGAQLNCELLEQAAISFKIKHFVAVRKSEDFKELDFKRVKELILRDDIVVSKEEEVYEAVISWVKHDTPARECLFPELLKCLRLFSMSKYTLREILDTEELVIKSRDCSDIIHDGMGFFLFPDLFQNVSLRPRTCLSKYESVVVLTGGHRAFKNSENEQGVVTDFTNCFLLSKNYWLSLPSMPCPRTRHGAAVCCGQLHVLEGNASARVCSFNPKRNTWNSSVEELPRRYNCSVTSFNEELYVIGGGGNKYRNRVDKYDPALDEWKKVTIMKTCREAHCAVVVAKLIYVIAGHDGNACHKSVECFSPSTNHWHNVADLNNARVFAAAATANGKIFVTGGYGNIKCQSLVESCEMFDPAVNQWSLVSSPTVPRAACGVISFDNHVYLFGGERSYSLKLDSVERYDVENDKWDEVSTMPEKLSCLQASLLLIPNKYLAYDED